MVIDSQEIAKIEWSCVLITISPEVLSLWVKNAQLCPTLCDLMDCSPPGSSVHGILQARILEWVAISFSRGSSQLRDRTRVSRIVDRRFTVWATREVRVWVNSCSWWWTGRPGMLQFMGSQRVGHDWATELNWPSNINSIINVGYFNDYCVRLIKLKYTEVDMFI